MDTVAVGASLSIVVDFLTASAEATTVTAPVTVMLAGRQAVILGPVVAILTADAATFLIVHITVRYSATITTTCRYTTMTCQIEMMMAALTLVLLVANLANRK